MHQQNILEMRDIHKHFPGVQALNGAQFSVRRGEIHALVGENGAGKSTLMNCLIGIFQPDSGSIVFDGREQAPYNTLHALNMGISMIHQELSPLLHRSIAENIWLGREPKNRFGLVDHRKMYEMTGSALNRIGLHLPPQKLMLQLTVAQMQLVEIAKALSYNAHLIIMDEPTTSFTHREVAHLFQVMHKLREAGKSIIYISHKLEEIYTVSDRITVMRDGDYIGTYEIANISQPQLIRLMVGRDYNEMFQSRDRAPSEVILEVENLSHLHFFSEVSFALRRGEILGVTGLMGAGRSEMIETVFGLRKKSSGKVRIKGNFVEIRSSRDAIRCGMALLTEDRRGSGIFPMLELWLNFSISKLGYFANKFGLFRLQSIYRECNKYVQMLQVKCSSVHQRMETLSGGNQQKALLGRWLMMEPDILLLDEPTKGIDVGAKAEIHRLISELAEEGKAIVMISSELPEILRISDRILVMCGGQVSKMLKNSSDITQETVMKYAINRDVVVE